MVVCNCRFQRHTVRRRARSTGEFGARASVGACVGGCVWFIYELKVFFCLLISIHTLFTRQSYSKFYVVYGFTKTNESSNNATTTSFQLHTDRTASLVTLTRDIAGVNAIVACDRAPPAVEIAQFGYTPHLFSPRIVSTSSSNADRLTPVQACVAIVLTSSQHITVTVGRMDAAILLMLHCSVVSPGLDGPHSFITIS
jgi:hypothetical protein